MEQKVSKFNQMGYCKFGKECHRYHEDKVCQNKNCNPNKCRNRHPKECKYYAQNSFCKFGTDCRFIHPDIVKKYEFGSVVDDIKNLKAEVDFLKNTVKYLTDIKHKGKVMKKIIDNLKSEIKQMQTDNMKTAQRIQNLEQDTESEPEPEEEETLKLEGLFSCTFCQS